MHIAHALGPGADRTNAVLNNGPSWRVVDPHRLARAGLGSLTAGLVMGGVTAMAAWPAGWVVAWLLAIIGLALNAAAFFVRRRDRRRLRSSLEEMAREWER